MGVREGNSGLSREERVSGRAHVQASSHTCPPLSLPKCGWNSVCRRPYIEAMWPRTTAVLFVFCLCLGCRLTAAAASPLETARGEEMQVLAKNLPHARYDEFRNSAHFPYAEEPEKFERDVAAFLAPSLARRP